MHKIFSALLFIGYTIAFLPVLGQQQPGSDLAVDTVETERYVSVEVMPEFPGGEVAMKQFISANLRYPETNNKVEGFVVLSAVVTHTGELKDIMVIKSLEAQHDLAAMQVIKNMPNWIPGTAKGKPVSVRTTVPIRFSYNGEKKKVKQKQKF